MGALMLGAITALKAAITTAIPTLEVRVGQPVAGKQLCFPSLSVTPVRFHFFPNQEEEYGTPDPDETDVIVRVGSHEGMVQLRLYTNSPGDRFTLEQKLLNIFWSPEGRPGVLVVPSISDVDVGTFMASFELDEEEWSDEHAFDSELGSVLPLHATIPALVKRTGVYTQEHLILALTQDFGTEFSPDTLLPPAVEVVEINDDGTITSPP